MSATNQTNSAGSIGNPAMLGPESIAGAPLAGRRGIIGATAAVLIIGMALSALEGYVTHKEIRDEAYTRFSTLSERLIVEAQRLAQLPFYGLNGVRGLYAASHTVERGEFHLYVRISDLAKEFPGVLGLGYIQRVMRTDLDKFIGAVRADDAAEFDVRTSGHEPDLFIIKLIEPVESNRPVWGYDIGSDPACRAAVERAMRTGERTLTGRVMLAPNANGETGFLYMVPVYKNGSDPKTVPEREAALVGLVCASIEIDELFAGVMDATGGALDIDVYEGRETITARLMLDADGVTNPTNSGKAVGNRMFYETKVIAIGGQEWTLVLSSTPQFEAGVDRTRPALVAVGGALLSVMLAAVIWSLGRSRVRAVVLATEMTADLRQSERRARLLYDAETVGRRATTIAEVIRHCLESVCAETGWPVGHAMATTLEGGLASIGLWRLPKAEDSSQAAADPFAEFRRVSEDFRFAPGQGLPGRVLQSASPLWISDIHKDANFPRAKMCAELNLHAAFAFPVLVSGRVAAVLEFFHSKCLDPDAGLLMLVESVGRAIGAVMERQQAQAALAENEERRRLVINTALDAVVAMDQAGRVTEWNSQAEATFGWTHDEVVGRPMHELVIPERLRAAHRDGLARYLSGGEPRVVNKRIEVPAVRKDGTEIMVELAITPVRSGAGDSSRIWFSAFLRDITDRKRAEVERERANAAEAANHAKSEFLANMSHEIRTPLNGVVGLLDLLLGTELNADQRRFGKLAKSSASLLTSVLGDILDLSKIEAGKLEISPSEFNLHEAVEEIMEMLAQPAAKKGLETVCHIEPDVPVMVRADIERLRQIIVNLVNNAVKFTERGAVVLRITPESRGHGRAVVRFTVTDTGIGIAPDRMDRLFKAFSQADASTTRLYGGTGLGLVISKQLAELMGGSIGVESEFGRGTTFWFTIDFQIPELAYEPVERPRLDPRMLRVLAVDDSEIQRDVLRQQIAAWGVEAHIAAGGDEALGMLSHAAASKAPFQVVIIDRDMPGMDGFELAMAIRSRRENYSTVLMIVLSPQEEIDPQQLREMGFAGHLTKPIRQSQLFNAIMDAITVAEMGRASKPPSFALASKAANAQATVPAGQVGFRILVAEDNEVNQIVVREVLIKAGHLCDVVPDGKQAVEAVQRNRYDLVLMDCQMPVMDGFDATRMIRSIEAGDPGLKPIAIVALTANAMKGDRERCLQAGMDGYASKPINPKELLRTIEQTLGARASACATTMEAA